MKAVTYLFLAALLGGGVFFLSRQPAVMSVAPGDEASSTLAANLPAGGSPEAPLPPAAAATTSPRGDIGPQSQLANPTEDVKVLYVTGWVAGGTAKLNAVMALLERTEANAVVIDIKDYSGYLSYETGVALAGESGAEDQFRIAQPNKLIQRLHEKGIYVIGRVTVFQDSILAKAHPEWALQSKSKGGLWRDRKGLAWMDPAAEPVWDYAVAIAKDAYARGFDEVNFDYIRFPSDGNLDDAVYPFSDEAAPKHETMREFYEYLRRQLPDERISADLFGLVTISSDDLGIGQRLEDALPYFDYVAPMVYPSHFANGFAGYKNPAAYPYEVMSYALEGALSKRYALAGSNAGANVELAKIRPWIQDFDLGVDYTPALVKKELQAVTEVLGGASSTAYSGYMVWDPGNNYENYGKIYN